MFLSGGCLEGNVKREAWQVQYARNGESTANLRKQAKPLNKKIKLRHGVVDAVAQPRREAPLFISIFFLGEKCRTAPRGRRPAGFKAVIRYVMQNRRLNHPQTIFLHILCKFFSKNRKEKNVPEK